MKFDPYKKGEGGGKKSIHPERGAQEVLRWFEHGSLKF